MYDIKKLAEGSTVNIVYDTDALAKDKGLIVEGTCSFSVASTFKDVAAKHNNLYSGLAGKPEKDPRKLLYLIVTREGGIRDYIADAWIRDVEPVKGIRVKMIIEVDNQSEVDEIKRIMAAKGINKVEWETIQ